MSVRFENFPIQIEQAVSTTGGSSRGLWLGYLASGVTHLAGGLLLGSVWGTAFVQLVPPPYGTSAIELTATRMVALDATTDDNPAPATFVKISSDEDLDNAAKSVSSALRMLRPDVGELPPAPMVIEFDPAVAGGAESPSPLAVATRFMKRPLDAPPIIEPILNRVQKKSTAPQPPVTSNEAAAPAPPSTRRQGQDTESLPQKTYSPAPVYPATALRQGITGRVVLRVRVAADGTVVAASVMRASGHAMLDEAALASVRTWRFQPARKLGTAIEKDVAVPITFRIDRSP